MWLSEQPDAESSARLDQFAAVWTHASGLLQELNQRTSPILVQIAEASELGAAMEGLLELSSIWDDIATLMLRDDERLVPLVEGAERTILDLSRSSNPQEGTESLMIISTVGTNARKMAEAMLGTAARLRMLALDRPTVRGQADRLGQALEGLAMIGLRFAAFCETASDPG